MPRLESAPDRVALAVDGSQSHLPATGDPHPADRGGPGRGRSGPGDRVALVNLGSELSVAAIYAAARLGAATAQMNAYLTPGELGQLAELVGAVWCRRHPVRRRPPLGTGRPGPGRRRRLPCRRRRPGRNLEHGDGEDTALVLFTSGTTGLPKPIAISHRVVTDRLAFVFEAIDPRPIRSST